MQPIDTNLGNVIANNTQGLQGPGILPYDNDVTLLYKWIEFFEVPVRLVIVRPRQPADANIRMGTAKYVFESLSTIVKRLMDAGESAADIYDIVTSFNKIINIDDIAMAYFNGLDERKPNTYRIINDVYRDIDNTITLDRFESTTDLISYYDSWVNELLQEWDLDMRRLTAIKAIQEELAIVVQEEPIPFGPVTINSTIMSFTPTINGKVVTSEDGIDIFNNAVTSRYIPYIKYNDQYNRSYSRVYVGDKVEDEPNYNITVIPSAESQAKNTIYMTLWLGDPEDMRVVKLHESSRDSFYTMVYHLDTNYLTIESPVNNDPKKGPINVEQVAVRRARSALPNLLLDVGKEIKVRGDFNVWFVDFDETVFLHMVLLEPLMNVYLYVEENIKPFALKKRLDVHYRSIFTDMGEGKTITEEAYISNSASVSITLNPRVTEIEELVEVAHPVTGVVTRQNLPAGTPYIQVNISQAESRVIVNEFIPIFRLLLRYYLDKSTEVSLLYRTTLPVLTALEPLLNEHKRRAPPQAETGRRLPVTATRDSKINRLRAAAPDLFVKDYPRRCMAPMHPIIVTPEEAEMWRQKRVGPNEELRQVMPFPKDNPRFHFVCPDDKYPYPSLKLNDILPNNKEYPLIPCCAKRDHMRVGSNSYYRDYVENKPIIPNVGAKAEKKPITRKILTPNKVAYLPESIENIVKRYSEDYIDMVRFGILYTPNSFLHCVCTAIDDPNYFRLQTYDEQELYVQRIRQHMLTVIKPALLKQEMYDYSDNEIMSLLADNNKFLDPSLFYRAIEELFQINVYIFAPPPPTGADEQLGTMVIPRFKIFHSHPPRPERPTVVILRTLGSESDALEYAHCELVVDYDKDDARIMKLFGQSMTEVCHATMQETLKTLTWTVNEDNTLKAHGNMYYYIDHVSLFQAPVVSQFIDDNGKMRALTLDIGGQLITIATIPSQPENVTVSKNMTRAPVQLALQMFGEPTAITKNNQGQVDGLWFQIMDIIQGEYVAIAPVISTNVPANILNKPIGPPNPIVAQGSPITGRLTRLRRTLNIITQLTRWLYELARGKENIDAIMFANQFMIADDGIIEDSSQYYDLSNIPRRLPIVETIEEAIRILTPFAGSFFNKGKIVMYSLLFANRIIRMLQDYSNLRIGMAPVIAEFLENYYETDSDFSEVPNSKIFMNEKDLTAWLLSLKSSQNYSRYFNIRTKIDASMGFAVDPYMYRDEDGKIYIIQNVIGGSQNKALAVAQTWEQYKVNVGNDPIPLDNTNPPVHMVYGISPSSTMIPIQDNTNNYDNFLSIVYYGSQVDKVMGNPGRYGALLRVL